jgi:DNA-binding sugar fermentation-stimulating protein
VLLAGPGRLSELLAPDATVILKEAKNRERKRQWI